MEQTPTKLWNRAYVFVLLINTFSSFSFYFVATILSKYLVGIGASISVAGVIVGLFSITSLVCRPMCGMLADRFSNVRLLKLSNVLMCTGLVGFAFLRSIPLIVVFRIIHGVGFAISGTAQIALATRHIPKKNMGEGIGYMGLGHVAASAAAPGIGLMIEESLGMQATFLTSACLTVISFVLLMTFHEGRIRTAVEKKAIHLRDFIEPRALSYTFAASTFSFANGVIAGYLVLFAEDRGIVGVSTYFTVYAVVLFLIRPFSGKAMDRFGLQYTVYPGMVIAAISMFWLGRSETLLILLATGVLRAAGQGAAQPSLQAGCINYVGQERSGVATSTYYLGGDIGQGIGPMVGGWILALVAGAQGYRMMFDLCGVVLLIGLGVFIVAYRKTILANHQTQAAAGKEQA